MQARSALVGSLKDFDQWAGAILPFCRGKSVSPNAMDKIKIAESALIEKKAAEATSKDEKKAAEATSMNEKKAAEAAFFGGAVPRECLKRWLYFLRPLFSGLGSHISGGIVPRVRQCRELSACRCRKDGRLNIPQR